MEEVLVEDEETEKPDAPGVNVSCLFAVEWRRGSSECLLGADEVCDDDSGRGFNGGQLCGDQLPDFRLNIDAKVGLVASRHTGSLHAAESKLTCCSFVSALRLR